MSAKKPTYREVVERAAKEWTEAHASEQQIKYAVFERLDASRDQIVLKLLGFDKSWGRDFELDHCNGRAGQSAAGDFIVSAANGAVKAWLAEQVGRLPDLSASARKSLIRFYHETLERELRRELARAAQERASEKAEEIMREVLGDLGVTTKEDDEQ